MIHSTQVISTIHQAISDYHNANELVPEIRNPFEADSHQHMLYEKAWIDNVQWHLEDEVRAQDITAEKGWSLKKQIDDYNQQRTNMVESLDEWFFRYYKDIDRTDSATINSETPGWIIDRLSILELKIYHMKVETERKDAGSHHVEECHEKLQMLLEQEEDLSTAFDQLLADLQDGRKYMKLYYQLKMYNNHKTNPALYRGTK